MHQIAGAKQKDHLASVSPTSISGVRYGYKSPHFHAKMGITMTIPITIPNIFSFVTRFAFAS
jgi:hypothetical protein